MILFSWNVGIAQKLGAPQSSTQLGYRFCAQIKYGAHGTEIPRAPYTPSTHHCHASRAVVRGKLLDLRPFSIEAIPGGQE